MSKVAITGNPSGTGTLTIAAPDTNSDRTLTLPDASGTVATTADIPAAYTDTDALELFNASGSAPVYACRAWVNFNGTSTVAIRASGNVSSITDNGTGLYTVNFTTAMPDADYQQQGFARSRYNATTGWMPGVTSWLSDTKTTSAFQIRVFEANNAAFDSSEVCVSFFR